MQQQEQEGVQVAMLRSMSNTRIAKFNRLLGEQVCGVHGERWAGSESPLIACHSARL